MSTRPLDELKRDRGLLCRTLGLAEDAKTKAKCPLHDDKNPSLSIYQNDAGHWRFKCFGCNRSGTVVDAVKAKRGVETDVAIAMLRGNGARPAGDPVQPERPQPKTKSKSPLRTHELVHPRLGEPIATYRYFGADERLVYAVCRFAGKNFRQARPEADGWIWNLEGIERVLYRLPELSKADPEQPVFVCEGEKDALALAGVGLVATTNPQGAGKWVEDDSALHGRHIVLVPDCDEPGKRHAELVAGRLQGKAKSVRILHLQEAFEGFTGSDVFDLLGPDGPLGCKEPDQIKQALLDAARRLPEYRPERDHHHEEPEERSPEGAEGYSPVIRLLSDVHPAPVRWLWPDRIALGKLTVLAGDPGLGKSFITLDMAMRVTTGTSWPDGTESGRGDPGAVVLLSAEDDPGDTIRPRLDAAGADCSRINLLEGVRCPDREGNPARRMFSLAEDIEALERAVEATPGCRLVIVDPISAYLGGTDSHKNADVRALLAPLSDVASRQRVAVLAVSHLRKGAGQAIYRTMGSLAFVAAARAVYAVTRDGEDEAGDRRLFLPVKNNLGNDRDGLAYRLAPERDTARVQWEPDPVAVSADDALSESLGGGCPGPEPDARDEAVAWLLDRLASGPVESKELIRDAKEEIGVSRNTLHNARRAAGVTSKRKGYQGATVWEIPNVQG